MLRRNQARNHCGFFGSFAHLNVELPQRKQRSNFYDALNAATVATLLYSSGHEAPVPIFVTQTRSIMSFGQFGFQNLMSRYATNLPFSLTNSPLFLSVFEALLARTEQRYLPAADQAKQLHDDAERLAIAAEVLLHHCKMQETTCTLIDLISALPRASWKCCCLERKHSRCSGTRYLNHCKLHLSAILRKLFNFQNWTG